MNRYTIVNWATAECIEVDAIAVECIHFSWCFYCLDEQGIKIERCYFGQRHWDIRDIKKIEYNEEK